MKIDHCIIPTYAFGNKRQIGVEFCIRTLLKVSIFVFYKHSRSGYRNVHILPSEGQEVSSIVFTRLFERSFKLN